jgi:hypothetical protein
VHQRVTLGYRPQTEQDGYGEPQNLCLGRLRTELRTLGVPKRTGLREHANVPVVVLVVGTLHHGREVLAVESLLRLGHLEGVPDTGRVGDREDCLTSEEEGVIHHETIIVDVAEEVKSAQMIV